MIIHSNPIDRSKYSIDLEGKFASLRHEMSQQMQNITKTNIRKQEQHQPKDVAKLLKRMTTIQGLPRKMPVFKNIAKDQESKTEKAVRSKA